MSDRLNESHRLWVEKRFPIRAEWLLVFGAALIAACGASGDVGRVPTSVGSPPGDTPSGPPSNCPGYPDQAHCSPPPADGRYSVSGVVTLRTTSGTAPLAGTAVGGFVIMTNGDNYGFMAPVLTDADGRYQFSNVPNGFVILGAAAPHAYQPCAAIEYEFPPEWIVLQTITDAQGRYSLCDLPAGRGALNVWLNGVGVAGSIVYISGDQVLDFDLTR